MLKEDPGVLEVMATARSMRWFRDDPVDPSLIERVVWAGTRASNPNNTQSWDFVVVTSPEVKTAVQAAITSQLEDFLRAAPQRASTADPTERRTALGARNLMQNLHRVPVLIFISSSNVYPVATPIIEWAYSAVYAAAQNMLVAARALGLGAAFTTLHRAAEGEVRAILQIPDDRILGVTMPLGWPARPFGPVTRRPVAEFVHHDRW